MGTTASLNWTPGVAPIFWVESCYKFPFPHDSFSYFFLFIFLFILNISSLFLVVVVVVVFGGEIKGCSCNVILFFVL